ncbi:MAG: helix-hairpin-helix domain-containing protein [Pseudomonadota bacterium]
MPAADEPVEAAAPAEASPSGGDDLKKLTGVGPVLAGKLADAGVTSFAQIAALSDDEIADIEEKVGASGKFEKEGWIAQAKDLAGG